MAKYSTYSKYSAFRIFQTGICNIPRQLVDEKEREYELSSIFVDFHCSECYTVFRIPINPRFLNSTNYMSYSSDYGPILMIEHQKDSINPMNLTLSMNHCMTNSRTNE